MTLTAEYLRERLHYDPEMGVFTWRRKPEYRAHDKSWNARYAGQPAGVETKLGPVFIAVDDEKYLAHRLAWLYVYGSWPSFRLDHKNRKRADNRIANLREADASLNAANSKICRVNTSGTKGVTWHKKSGKWMAQITAKDERIYLGLFRDKAEAAAAYMVAAERHFGEFATDGL